MKTLDEIFAPGRDPHEIVSYFRSHGTETVPSWEDLETQYDPTRHRIVTDPTLRPPEKQRGGMRDIPAKIAYPAEKIVTRRMVQMMFSIPVRRTYSGYDADDAEAQAFVNAIEAVYKSARIDGENKDRMRAYFAACAVATVWYVVDEGVEHTRYGFPTKKKIKCRSYSPMPRRLSKIDQAEILPLFDDTSDLVALGFRYRLSAGRRASTEHFDCYTASKAYYYTFDATAAAEDPARGGEAASPGGGGLAPAVVVVPNPTGKIPAVYADRTEPIYVDVEMNREEIEFTNSRNSDVVKKNSAPIVVVHGELLGDNTPVSEAGREAYQVTGDGAGVEYLASPLALDHTTRHINTQKQMIAEITQLPDLSLENIKGLGAISGEARRTLLTDAHLKVGEEADGVVLFLDREFAVIKSLMVLLRPEWRKYQTSVMCRHVVTPFTQNDRETQTRVLISQIDGGIKSRRTSMAELGDFDDIDREIELIDGEREADREALRVRDVFEGAV